jgi:hypothetical protein
MAGDQESPSAPAPSFIEKFETAPGNDQIVHAGYPASGGIAEIVEHSQEILETSQTELRGVLVLQLSEVRQ